VTQAAADGNEKSFWPTVATVVAPTLAIGGLVLYCLLNILYNQFYGALGIEPGDVGLTYTATIASSSGLMVIVALCLAICVVLLVLVSDQSNKRRLVLFALILILNIASISLVILAVMSAKSIQPADAVKHGRPVRPAQLGFLVMFPIHADPATVSPVGKPNDATSITDLSGEPLLYLGQNNAIVVLYNSRLQQIVRIPASSVIMNISNCETRLSPSADCKKVYRPS
jgi:hypothetical protein